MFKSSLTVMTVARIPIKIHISFLLILPFLMIIIGNNIGGIAEMAGVSVEDLAASPYWLGFTLAILLFASVALHELAHSFVARAQGVEIQDITLMLLGGVAQMDDDAEDQRDEVWIALSGPLFSLVFGVALLGMVRLASGAMSADLNLVVYYLGFMNIFLAIFNMLPAFPSDGGRVLRSLLARTMSYRKATQIATSVGKTFAILFAAFGLLIGHIFLILIGLFIYVGASQESQFNVLQETFSGFAVADLMTRDVSTVHENMTAEELLNRMFEERHSGYPVMDDQGNLVGCVTMHDIQSTSPSDRQRDTVRDIMTRELITVRPDEDLFAAFKKLSRANIGRLLVIENGDLEGILTRSDIMTAYRLKSIQQEQVRLDG